MLEYFVNINHSCLSTSEHFHLWCFQVLKDHGQDFLVGNSFSWADVHLLEAILMVEEKKSDVLSSFPQLQVTDINSTLIWMEI